MKHLLLINALLFLLVMGCKKEEDEVIPESPYKFQYEAPFKAYVYVWYYSGGKSTTRSYNERNSNNTKEALPNEIVSLEENLVKDSVVILFSNPDNPSSGTISASIYKNSDKILSTSKTDTALYVKVSF